MADEVQADRTPGFKVGEKKTLEDYHKLGEFMPLLISLSSQQIFSINSCVFTSVATSSSDETGVRATAGIEC